jgi:uncharacterized protein (DUF433 family)
LNSSFATVLIVNSEQEQSRMEAVIVRDPKVLGGVAIFRRTRVPFQALLDYLEQGQTLDDFLTDFPTVSRGDAIAALEQAKSLLVAQLQ